MDHGQPTRDKSKLSKYGTDHKIALMCHKPVTKVWDNAYGFKNRAYSIDNFMRYRTHIFRQLSNLIHVKRQALSLIGPPVLGIRVVV